MSDPDNNTTPVIIYIDDQPTNLVVFEAAAPEDWQVHVFDDPDKAAKALRNISPWVILSDQRMARMTGADLLTLAKQEVPEALRIIVTGYSDEEAMIDAVRRAKIFDYMKKPWDPDELVIMIEKAIRQYRDNQELKRIQEMERQAEISLLAVEEADRQKSEFLANISHELKTPLNTIIGYTELLLNADQQNKDPVKQDTTMINDLKNVLQAADHLHTMIEAILDIAHDKADNLKLNPADVVLNNLLAEVQEVCLPHAEKNQNILTIESTVDSEFVTDPIRLKQILINLVINACKFTRNGTVRVVVEQDGERISFSVHDTGIGIRPEQKQDIFKSFLQLDMSRTKEVGGAGVGLDICQRLARRMGGEIVVSSQYGVGSTFTLLLPMRLEASGE